MAKQKQKFYVVWKGTQTGVFDNWDECSKQIHGLHDAIYKSFKTRAVMEAAFKSSPDEHIELAHTKTY